LLTIGTKLGFRRPPGFPAVLASGHVALRGMSGDGIRVRLVARTADKPARHRPLYAKVA
jgi:hypothetical protein